MITNSMDELEKLKKSCRLCLTYEQDVSLFSEYRCQLEFFEIATCLANIEIRKNDHLPKKICQECASKLVIFYKFKQKCESSSNTLLALLDEPKDTIIIPDNLHKNDEQPSLMYFKNLNEINTSDISPGINLINKNESFDYKSTDEDTMMVEHKHDESQLNKEIVDKEKVDVSTVTVPIIIDKLPNVIEKKVLPTKKPTHQCELCGNTFGQISSLNQHYITHTGIKDFSCTICSKKFTRKSHLKIHLRMHYNIREYICEICSRGFTKSGDLRRHQRIHNDLKNYECSVCKKRFRRSTDVTSHMNSHTGFRPYRCNNCDKAYSSHSSLKKHKIKFHVV